MAVITTLFRALKHAKDHVCAAQLSTAWLQLVQVDVSNELKSDTSIFSVSMSLDFAIHPSYSSPAETRYVVAC